MKRRLLLTILALIVFLQLSSGTVLAQLSDADVAMFASIQRQLAGDPANWSIRLPDPSNGFLMVPTPETPAQVIVREDRERATEFFSTSSWAPGEIIRRNFWFDPKSKIGRFIRKNSGSRFFMGGFILKTDKTTELGKIKDLYGQVVSRVTRFGDPQGGNVLGACLQEQTGVCRHMATILHESLRNAGVKSQLMVSPDHLWNRVTISDVAYGEITFDLDPTWYQQPIPLPPRELTPISPEWRQRMLASTVVPAALNLNGTWINDDGSIYEFTHSGNGLAGTLVEGYPGWIGKIIFSGQLTDLNFTGNDLWRGKDKCSKWERSSSASGSVSSDGNTFTIISRSPYYYRESCEFAYEGEEEIDTYTRKKP